ncbi:MAG TPA: rhodanese-like domain-containing protein [Candidatus Limnocylindria bacterium]|jgi:rhodanese-related sulfurtransferase|nr:rhodanese-like domain-containing protein [Candidatus Limnocylindria bacterium]
MKAFVSSLAATLVLALSLHAEDAKVPDISHAQLKKAMAEKKVTLIDVNGTDSWKEGHIPGAIDFDANEKSLASLLPADKDALVVAYCGNERCPAYKLGAKAALALGYKNVKHYAAGIDGWKKRETVETATAAK